MEEFHLGFLPGLFENLERRELGLGTRLRRLIPHLLDVAKSKLSILPSAPGVHFSVLRQCQDMLALRVKGDLGNFNITRKGNGLWRGKRGREVVIH